MNQLEIFFGSPLTIQHVQVAAPSGYATLTIIYQQFTITARGDVMYNLMVDHFVKMKVSYVDAAGNPAVVDGPVAWASSDASIATVAVDATDSSIVTVTPAGDLGQVQVTATADADLGSGVRNLNTVADITVLAGEAVAGTIQPVGAPQPKP